MKNLVSDNNQIKILEGLTFAKLTKLTSLALEGNECINKNFVISSLEDIMFKVSENCTATVPISVECGQVKVIKGLVIGGTESKRGHWPFLVALHHVESNSFFCGGSLITSQHVLTGLMKNLTTFQFIFNSLFTYSCSLHSIQGIRRKTVCSRDNCVTWKI